MVAFNPHHGWRTRMPGPLPEAGVARYPSGILPPWANVTRRRMVHMERILTSICDTLSPIADFDLTVRTARLALHSSPLIPFGVPSMRILGCLFALVLLQGCGGLAPEQPVVAARLAQAD